MLGGTRSQRTEVGDATELSKAEGVPARDRLTFTNGFYTYCSSLFVNIRGSAELAKKHRLPTHARLYRAYISEMTGPLVQRHDCLRAEHPRRRRVGPLRHHLESQIDDVFSVAAQAHSLARILSHKLIKAGLSLITVGLGLSYGRVLMTKAGYKDSGMNDVVWMGDAVNAASHLSNYGNRTLQDRLLMVSDAFHDNLSEHNRPLLSRNWNRGCYHGNVINSFMDELLKVRP